jgi:hypothetical protein
MIFGAHFIVFSKDADADRKFLRDVLNFPHVDAGHGWLIFGLPPSEIAVHPGNAAAKPQAEANMADVGFYLMCDDLDATLRSLSEKGVKHAPIDRERWGHKTTIALPSGSAIGLYQPLHPLAISQKGTA